MLMIDFVLSCHNGEMGSMGPAGTTYKESKERYNCMGLQDTYSLY